jgi:hypothetical protein
LFRYHRRLLDYFDCRRHHHHRQPLLLKLMKQLLTQNRLQSRRHRLGHRIANLEGLRRRRLHPKQIHRQVLM